MTKYSIKCRKLENISKNILQKIKKKAIIYLTRKEKKKIFNLQETKEDVKIRRGSKIMCKAAEVGKIVINKCIDMKLDINSQKLQKLLVLMQIECIKISGQPLFKEDIRVWTCGVAIKEVDEEFRWLGGDFVSRQEEYILLLEREEESVNKILNQYGNLDAIELNSLPEIQKVISLSIKTDDTAVPHVNYQILVGAFFDENSI